MKHFKSAVLVAALLSLLLPSLVRAGNDPVREAYELLANGEATGAAGVVASVRTPLCGEEDLLSPLIPIVAPWHAPVDACTTPPQATMSRPPLFPHGPLKAGQHVFTTARWVHLRAGPSSEATILDDFFMGTELEVVRAGKTDDSGEKDGWVAVSFPRARVVEFDLRKVTDPKQACPIINDAPSPAQQPLRAWVGTALVSTTLPEVSELVKRADQAVADNDEELALLLLDRASALAPNDAPLRKRVVQLALDRKVFSTAAWAGASDIDNLITGDIVVGCRGNKRQASVYADSERDSTGRNACLVAAAFDRPCVRPFYDNLCGPVSECNEHGIDAQPDLARERRCYAKWKAGEAARKKEGKAAYEEAVRTHRDQARAYQGDYKDGPWVRLTLHGMRSPTAEQRLKLVVGQDSWCDEKCNEAPTWRSDRQISCDAGPALKRGETLIIWAKIPSAEGASATAYHEPSAHAWSNYSSYFFGSPGQVLDAPGIVSPVGECREHWCSVTDVDQCLCED